MIIDVVMPKLGESITEGTIIQWRKKAGEAIGKDEILLEIGTDKVDSEIPSPVEGVVVEILASPNDVIPVGEVIARIESEEGVVTGALPAEILPSGVAATPTGETISKETAERVPVPPASIGGASAASVREKRPFYTPLVRAIARREKISEEELRLISGSGKEGRVTKRDVLAYLERRKRAPRAKAPTVQAEATGAPAVPAAMGLEEEIVEMSRLRQMIAEHMRKSLDTSAHVYLMSECDVTGIVHYVRSEQAAFQNREGFRLTYTPFFVLAAVKAIQDYPIFNTSLDGNKIIYHKCINIGLAVAVEKGLMVPVIPKCEELNFLGICRKVHHLAERTRAGTISPDELQGSTFSITNYGIFGNVFGTPIINQPNVAILGVGAIKKLPVVRETEAGDAIVIRSIAYLSIGIDHRLIDGAGGGRFLKRMVDHLENLDTQSLL